ncbi:MAG: hypothetical protein MJ052_04300 [Sphaerochaetaceae bacterium]|nr:hypothetical protein [Sphaerochaetaceae bacterium]
MEKNEIFERYNDRTHVLGRLFSLITVVFLLASPFVIGVFIGAMPDIAAAMKGFVAVGIVWLVVSVVEFLVYTPMLGAGGSYLGFITGNLINMKMPCADNARDMTGAKVGTPENEIISTLAIATSALVTVAVLSAGVLLLQPLRPVLQSEVLRPAFANVVAALFGSLAYKYFSHHLKIAVFPLILMVVLFVFLPSLASSASIMMIPAGGLAILVAWLDFRKPISKFHS